MKMFRLIPALAVLLCAVPRLPAQLVGDDELPREDGIQAVINDAIITTYQLYDYTWSARVALRRQSAGQPQVASQQKRNALLNDGMEQLVERQLILRDFTAQGYRMPDSYLEELVQERIRATYSDRVTLMKTLQAEGKSFESYRQEVRDQAIVTFMRSKNILQEIIISPYKIQVYYQAHQDDFKVEDEVKMRMIVLTNAVSGDTNTLNVAREIRDKIKGGASFADMANIYSQDPQRSQGGERPWQERSVLRKELGDAAAALPVNQVSDPIETPDACYLIFIEEKRPAHFKPLNEVRDEIERSLRAQEQSRLEKQWIAKLKAKSFVLFF
jgi:peptidyl-prolyl cis-trans isomerase SurA